MGDIFQKYHISLQNNATLYGILCGNEVLKLIIYCKIYKHQNTAQKA